MKKTISVLLAALLAALCLPVYAFAAPVNPTGTITVEKTVEGQTYTVYRIFDLQSYDADKGAYSYCVNDNWKSFVEQTTVSGVYVNLDAGADHTYVTWVPDADVKEFAKMAIAWAKANNTVSAIDQKTADASGTLEFADLPLGYYLIDSSVGALCALTTTNPNATVQEKNELTTIDKEVREDSTGDYGKENSAQIGDTVEFKSMVTVGAGVENLVVHDTMDTALTLNANSFTVKIGTDTVDTASYTVKTTGLNDGCTFEIAFDNAYTAQLSKGTVLLIEYTAVLNSTAKINQNSNDNTTYVTFGQDLRSTTSTTKTYTFKFNLVKTDSERKMLDGAEFSLHYPNGTAIKLVNTSTDDTNKICTYRLATADDGEDTVTTSIKAGIAIVQGLDKDVYLLVEEKAPKGYNKLNSDIEVDMTGGDILLDTTQLTAADGSFVGAEVPETAGGIQIMNKSGTELPSTGGMGTRLFYVGGSIVICLAAAVMLMFRRKEEV